jgi:beta-glucanase (GH16 family)
MLLEDSDSYQHPTRSNRDTRQASRPTPPRRPRRVFATVAVIAAVLVIAAVGFVFKMHSGKTVTPQATRLSTMPTKTAETAKTAPPAKAKTVTAPKSYKLTFESSFAGSALDTTKWGTCYPWAPTGCTNYGNNGDPDQEWYQASQDTVQDGALHITAQRTPTAGLAKDGSAKEYACRSGMVTTYPSLQFKYGFIQVVAKIPFSKGLWPALWLAAANKVWPPEVDILEHWASQPNGKVYFHPNDGHRVGGPVSTPGLGKGYHTFTLSWTKTRLTWYYDNTKIFTATNDVPQQDMYFIANVADDDAGPGGCTGTMIIKSVKVWQPSA